MVLVRGEKVFSVGRKVLTEGNELSAWESVMIGTPKYWSSHTKSVLVVLRVMITLYDKIYFQHEATLAPHLLFNEAGTLTIKRENMPSTIKTAGSFDQVLASCKSIGERYQPQAPTLSITALSMLSERSNEKVKAVIDATSAYSLAVNNRREAFADLQKLSVRIVRMLSAVTKSKEHLRDAINLKTILQGKTIAPRDQVLEGGEDVATRGPSRNHYVKKMVTFERLVKLVEDIGSYKPNEQHLTIEALREKLADLKSRSQEVAEKKIVLMKAVSERDEVMFGEAGVVATVKAVKDYIRGAFGSTSPEFYRVKVD